VLWYGAHIGDATVGCAVGLAGEDRVTAEPEIGGSRLSKRPVAPVRTAWHDLGEARHRVRAVRDAPWRQIETPGLADHGVFGDAEPAADFGGGVSLVPELAQSCCVIFVPSAGRRVVLHGALLLQDCPSPRRLAARRARAPIGARLDPCAAWRRLASRRDCFVRGLYCAAKLLSACGSLPAAGASSAEIVAARWRAAYSGCSARR